MACRRCDAVASGIREALLDAPGPPVPARSGARRLRGAAAAVAAAVAAATAIVGGELSPDTSDRAAYEGGKLRRLLRSVP